VGKFTIFLQLCHAYYWMHFKNISAFSKSPFMKILSCVISPWQLWSPMHWVAKKRWWCLKFKCTLLEMNEDFQMFTASAIHLFIQLNFTRCREKLTWRIFFATKIFQNTLTISDSVKHILASGDICLFTLTFS